MVTKSAFGIDHLGMAASTTCAIHCMVMALLPSGLALGGFQALFGHEAEWVISISVGLLAILAAFMGYRMHGSRKILAIMAAATCGIFVSRFAEEWGIHTVGTIIGVVSSLVLAFGHLLNLRAMHACKTCS